MPTLIKCLNCGRAGLKSKQALRGHLAHCPGLGRGKAGSHTQIAAGQPDPTRNPLLRHECCGAIVVVEAGGEPEPDCCGLTGDWQELGWTDLDPGVLPGPACDDEEVDDSEEEEVDEVDDELVFLVQCAECEEVYEVSAGEELPRCHCGSEEEHILLGLARPEPDDEPDDDPDDDDFEGGADPFAGVRW